MGEFTKRIRYLGAEALVAQKKKTKKKNQKKKKNKKKKKKKKTLIARLRGGEAVSKSAAGKKKQPNRDLLARGDTGMETAGLREYSELAAENTISRGRPPGHQRSKTLANHHWGGDGRRQKVIIKRRHDASYLAKCKATLINDLNGAHLITWRVD